MSTKRAFFVFALTGLLTLIACKHQGAFVPSEHTDANGFTYISVSQDPLEARIYTLENGLKVFLTVNRDEPRIASLIGVRAGAAYDPEETTGLAHYFEHMMFKGTDEIGTLDWEKEKDLLDRISVLFEEHRAAGDPEEKARIYKAIDSLSVEAARYCIPNEYDKMVSALGAKRTNAGTSLDYTVYINDIPSNALEKWAMLESERFSDIVLRLFHTELETVYEEFNMYQDMDRSRARSALMEGLFPNHPYGRDVIGLPEHLKNPSMANIYQFAETYYRPNNMAVALSGDLDFEAAIQVIDKYFGKLERGDIPEQKVILEEPIEEPVVKEVVGKDKESVQFAFRFDGYGSNDHAMVTMIDMILSNSKAGLIDLHLNQEQKVLQAGSYPYFLKDYGMHSFTGTPRQGQTLEEVKDLLLAEIDKVKNGEFEDWLPEAILNDMRLQEIRAQENNFSRVFKYISAFTKFMAYEDELAFLDKLEKITRDDIIQFARERYNDNYVVVYKRHGEPQNLIRVEKPPITSVTINREDKSAFHQAFDTMATGQIKPVFVDFASAVVTEAFAPGADLSYIRNEDNELFTLVYILDMGSKHDRLLPLAVEYLPYLGTGRYTPAGLQQELFRLGLSMDVNAGEDRCYVSLSGLETSFEKGVELLEHVLSSVVPDTATYRDYMEGILKKRADDKLNKNTILWSRLFNYGKYGPFSPVTHILSEAELANLDPAVLADKLHQLTSYKHKVFYYGTRDLAGVRSMLRKHHQLPESLNDYPPAAEFIFQESHQNRVFFVDYDMVQANILMMAQGPSFDPSLVPPARLFGEYFGSGLSSIVFQEIRESKALAYSAFSAFSEPRKLDEPFYLYGFVGTQADKLHIATEALMDLMNNMPRAEKQFEMAAESMMRKIETERIIKTQIYWTWQRMRDLGLEHDIRRDVYQAMTEADMDAFEAFFNEYIAGKKYSFLVMGKKEDIDMNVLAQLGVVKELTLEEIFGY